ncbi:MAG: hypothetical protein JWM53_4755 [bacterium]|nr:hypothetical protein [bacterium]
MQSLLARIQRPAAAANIEERLERMRVREDAFSELDRIALMIDATLARIEREQFATANARNTLNARHERSVVTWSIAATLTGSGVSVVATSLQFSGTTQARIGNGLAIGGAALAAAFSIVALTRKNRSTPPYAIETNFLAQPLGRTPTPDSRLPDPVWSFLDTTLVGERGSFRSQLVDGWLKERSISLASSAQAQRTIDLLTSPISPQQSVPAEVLSSRANMLADLSERIAEMKIELESLVRQVRAHVQ